MGSLAAHQGSAQRDNFGVTIWKEYTWSWWDTLAAEELFSTPKMEYAAGMNPNMDSYSSETIQSVFTHICIYYKRGGEIAKPDHFKRQMHIADMKVNPVIMAY